MPIRTKRWNDPIEPEDGTRILITRYRPRGLPKAEETWDLWLKELAPSADLLAAFDGKGRAPVGWSAYKSAYLQEMRQSRDTIAELANRVIAGQTITLLCSSRCLDERRCHRSLLKHLIEREIARQNDES